VLAGRVYRCCCLLRYIRARLWQTNCTAQVPHQPVQVGSALHHALLMLVVQNTGEFAHTRHSR
jgi:hypothetical protein